MSKTDSLSLRHDFFKDGSVDVEPAKDGEGPVRRLAAASRELLARPADGINTTSDIIAYATKKYDKMKAVGWRDIIKVHEENKEVKKTVNGEERTETKTWKYFELSDYKYIDYTELEARTSQAGRGLAQLGITTDNIFNVYASTGLNWQVVSQGCALISTTVATAYDTLGESGLEHSLNEPECAGIFTNSDLLSTLLKVLSRTPSVKLVVYDGEPEEGIIDKIQNVRSGIRAIHIDKLLSIGKTVGYSLIHHRLPTSDTTACIMYTSGSTGRPKGVCLTHGNLIASVASVHFMFEPHIPSGDRYLAYLPLAHVLEYIVEFVAFFAGITVGYARPKTLTDNSVRNCKGDLAEFQPNIMFGVPTVWESMKKGIINQVNASGLLSRRVFWGALSAKKASIPLISRVADNLVLRSVRTAAGGQHLKFAMSGSASISNETQDFLTYTMMPLMQAYGLTESCGMCTLLPPEISQTGSVGLPVPSVEIKFLDVPEAGYSSKNAPPAGEICIRGPSVTKGYFKRPDLNDDESVFTKDGWFRTGDVGQWNEDGTISLIDRIKNLIKLQHGEYIALEHLEAVYKSCDLVSNICVYASAEASQPLAIIVPHESNLKHVISSSASLSVLCDDESIKDKVLQECNAVGRKEGLRQVELLCDVILTPKEWKPENGFLTAARKIERSKITKTFKNQIDSIYKKQD